MGHTPMGYKIVGGVAVIDEPPLPRLEAFMKITYPV